MNKASQYLSLSFLLFLSTGCSHYYEGSAEAYAVTYELVPAMEIVGKTTLINGHSEDDEHTFLKMGLHKHIGDYHQFTDSVIKQVNSSLVERGMTQQESEKSLKITILEIERVPAMWVFRIITHVEVEDHLGNKYQIEGNNATGGNLYRAVNGSLHRVATTLLNDKDIQNYLAQ